MGFVEKFKIWALSEDVEDRLFITALLFGIPYFGSSIIFDLIYQFETNYILLDSVLLGICLTFYFLCRFKSIRPIIINIFCALLIGGFIYFWSTAEGIKGGAAYSFPVLSALIILLTKGAARYIYSIALVLLLFIITSDIFPVTGVARFESLFFEYHLNLFILTFLLLFFKVALDNEKHDLEVQNQQNNELNKALSIKTAELQDYNKEIELIHQNLEKLVNQRTEKLRIENERDLEYSFINAHLVRAPIANMMAIVELIEDKDQQIIDLSQKITELDSTVRKIGEVLSKDR
ncbi:hypothetical protein [Ekhidna sp.]|uniref:hypothetical protein n=1 Tax=Ekhidna sp. TaxID=2608089 RepID=UPI003CCC3CEA